MCSVMLKQVYVLGNACLLMIRFTSIHKLIVKFSEAILAMFIHDLEFIDSGKEGSISRFAIEGGASASASVSANAYDSQSIAVTASADSSGDLSRTGVTYAAKVLNREANPRGYGGYIAGYGGGYAVAYGVDRYGYAVRAYDSESVTI